MNDKLQKLKEQHEIEEYDLHVDENKNLRLRQAYMFLGGIHTVKKIANSLNAQHLRAIQAIESEKLYLDMGFEKFVDFLASDESPIGKTAYYDRIKLLESEGEQVFDLLNEVGLTNAIRKKLAESNYGDISIEGNTVRIGDETADLSNMRMIKTLIESFSNDCRKLTEQTKKQNETIQKMESQVSEGSKQVEQLRRQLDTNNEGSALDRAQSRLINAFIKFNDELAEVPLIDRIDKDSVLDTLWMLLEESRKRFGSNKNFTVQTTNQPDVDPLIAQALEDGFDD
jgi:hypothetical protein